ncbi:MAG: transposase [Thermoanaerobaculia bacterium]|nr:transposase [Thermoanaerobaculia bacterium]
MVSVVQTLGGQLDLHPHVHAVVTRGGWTGFGTWPPPYVSASAPSCCSG